MIVRRAILSIGLAIVAAAGAATLAAVANAQSPPAPRATTALAPASTAPGPEIPRSYERKGRRDPFQPLETAEGDGGPSVAAAQLKGIIHGRTPRVLIETPDGIGYILRLGDSLGDGRLVEIGAESVVFSVAPRPGSTTDRIVLRFGDK